MFGRRRQTAGKAGGGETGDEHLPPVDRDDDLPELDQPRDLDLGWDEDDDVSRRRDPLRRP